MSRQNQLGILASSARFKKDIVSINKASEAIFSLNPVMFHYNNDDTSTPQFGLIAEEVARVDRALITVDQAGKPFSVRYEQINAMLLNEFLKEHRKVEEQEKRIDALTAQLKEQAAQIQKVSAQVGLTNLPLRTAATNPQETRD